MKRFWLLLLAAAAWAGTTTVTQTILGPDGQPASGQALIRLSAPCQSGANYIGERTIQVKFTAGVFSVSLIPNDTCVPNGTSYTVAWQLTGGPTWMETWVIPTSSIPVSVDSVKASSPLPTPLPTINPAQISAAGGVAGQALCLTGTGWGPGNCGGVGAGGFLVNSVPCTSAPVFDLALGNVQQITLTCHVTSASVAHLAAGMVILWSVCQDGTGGWTWTWPGAVSSGVTVGALPGKCSSQWFYSPDGVKLVSQGIGVVNQ